MLTVAILFTGQEVHIRLCIDICGCGNSLPDQRRLNACAVQRSWKVM